jgi:hypothetical protein
MDANDENTTDELKKANKRIKKYTSRYARVRDQIGEEEWNRLTRLDKLRTTLITALISICGFLVYGAFWELTRFQYRTHLWKDISSVSFNLHQTSWLPNVEIRLSHLIILTIIILIFCIWILGRLRKSELDKLEWHGQDPEKIESALLLEEEARSWKEAIPEITAEDQLLEAKAAGPSWWRVELSGLHLVLWIGVLLALSGLIKNSIIPEKLQITGLVVAIIGWLIKICCWIIWILRDGSAQTKLSLLRFYRSCGTWRGSATFIAILVLSVFLIGLICWLISLFFQ